MRVLCRLPAFVVFKTASGHGSPVIVTEILLRCQRSLNELGGAEGVRLGTSMRQVFLFVSGRQPKPCQVSC